MAAATATACSGHVRSQRRARTSSRGCWRLVLLLGLTWFGLLLLGGTAHATCADRHCDASAAEPPAGTALPLVGRLLDNVGTLTTTTLGGLTAAPAQGVVDAIADADRAGLPVTEGLEAASIVADAVRETAGSAGDEQLLDVRIPSLTATAIPVVDGLGRQLVSTADSGLDAVELTVPLPLAGGLSTLRSVVDTLDDATERLVATTSAVTETVDGVVDTAGAVLSPLVASVTAPAGTISVTTAGAAAVSDLPAAAAEGTVTGAATDHPPAAGDGSLQADAAVGGRVLTGPAVPPPDASADSGRDPLALVVQPAADIVTSLPVPVSGAGSTSGNGGTSPAPVLDQTLVRVESEAQVEADTTEPVEGPSGPMPGTPAADPAFSPD